MLLNSQKIVIPAFSSELVKTNTKLDPNATKMFSLALAAYPESGFGVKLKKSGYLCPQYTGRIALQLENRKRYDTVIPPGAILAVLSLSPYLIHP